MAYRMDWQVTFRAIGRNNTERLMGELQETIGARVQIHGEWPSRRFHSCRNCRFSTAEWNLAFPEAVVKSVRLAQRLGQVWQFSLHEEDDEIFSGFFTDERSALRMIGVARATFTLVPASIPLPSMPNATEITFPGQPAYTIIIDAEFWESGWDPADSSSLVFVEFSNGDSWFARVHTLRNVETQVPNMLSRNGRYFWESGIIIIEKLTRPDVEATITDMLQQGTFQYAFEWAGGDQGLEITEE